MNYPLDHNAEAGYQHDLALLQHLKEVILNGQHPFYRPVPRPDMLYSLYQGPRRSHVLPHPEQVPDYHHPSLSQPLGSSSHPVVVDSDSSRQSSVEPLRQTQEDVSRKGVALLEVAKKPVASGGPSAPAQQRALPPTAPSASSAMSNTRNPPETLSSASAPSKEQATLPKSSRPESNTPSAIVTSSTIPPVKSNQFAVVSSSSSAAENGRPRQVAAPLPNSEPIKSAQKPSVSEARKSDKHSDSREGVWEHRVIYEREPSTSGHRPHRPDDIRRDRQDRSVDRLFRPRDDHMDIDLNGYERRRSTSLRPDNQHHQPRHSQLPGRAPSVSSSDTRSEGLETRQTPVLIADERKLPQDRLFPPDDPRAPIDNTMKKKIVEKSVVSESPKPVVTPANTKLTSAFDETKGIYSSEVPPSEARPSGSAVPKGSEVDMHPNGSSSNSFDSGARSPVLATSVAIPPKLQSHPPLHSVNTSGAKSEDGPQALSQSTTTHTAAAPAPTIGQSQPKKDLMDRIDMASSSSASLLNRISDAPRSAPGGPIVKQELGGAVYPPPPSRQDATVLKPKAEPVDDHRALLSNDVKYSVRPSSSLSDMRPPVSAGRERTTSTSSRVQDMPRRPSQSPPRPASYFRPPTQAYDPRAVADDRHRSAYHRPAPRPEVYERRGPYNENGWLEYGRQATYQDRGREVGRPALGDRLSSPRTASAYRDIGRYPEPESRVRRRSPSYGSWDAPPPKRARDDAYPDESRYYDPPRDDTRELYYENLRLREAMSMSAQDNYYEKGYSYDDGRRW